MKTLRDYHSVRPTDTSGDLFILTTMERIIQSMGHTWYDMPIHKWPLAFEKMNFTSSDLCDTCDKAIRDFYLWLDAEKELPYIKASYSSFKPKLGGNIPIGLALRTLPSLEVLIDYAFASQSISNRLTQRLLETNVLMLCLVWSQFSVAEITELKPHDVSFYVGSQKVDVSEISAVSAVSFVRLHLKNRDVTMQNATVVQLLYTQCLEAKESEASHLFMIHDKPLSISTADRRLSSVISDINERYHLMLSTKFLRSSGMYYCIYKRWKDFNLPWVYSDKTVPVLLELRGLPSGTSAYVKQTEFFKLLEYARVVQGEPI